MNKLITASISLLLAGATTAYAAPASAAGGKLSGVIKVDGSSTVYPITEAVAEEFQKLHNGVNVTVGISGTGGGFKKFTVGETDISDASRPIKAAELASAKEHKIDYVELPVAYDALTIVVNPKNTWVKSLTIKELKKMWEPEAQGKIMKWNQINPAWPDQPLHLFGAGVDSGTYDYFTEAVNGKEHASRGDFTSSEDDNVIVQGVANDVNALGFFGLAYYEENKNKLKAIPVDDEKDENGKGPQSASVENVLNSTYQPLSRPLFIYVSQASAAKPEVKAFVEFYLQNGEALAREVGYVPLKSDLYNVALARFQKPVTGSMFAGLQSWVGVKLEDLMKKGGA